LNIPFAMGFYEVTGKGNSHTQELHWHEPNISKLAEKLTSAFKSAKGDEGYAVEDYFVVASSFFESTNDDEKLRSIANKWQVVETVECVASGTKLQNALVSVRPMRTSTCGGVILHGVRLFFILFPKHEPSWYDKLPTPR
jgi:hypothetical protein